jgi:aspartate aminotransferase
MPNVSERSRRVPLSPFRKLAPLAEQARERGVHVYHLNIGQPDIETPAHALEKLKQTDLKILAYSPATGLMSYRRKLVDYYRKFDISLSPEEIIITTGASEAIQLAMFTCLDQGDEIVVPEPFYANYNGFAQIAGVGISPITCSIDDGFALPEISAFEKAVTPQTKAVFITNPNNPTGCYYPKEKLLALADLVKKYDLFLFADEVYREFCYDGNEFFSVLNIPEIQDRVVVLDSVSKRFSACGARVGALVARNPAILASVSRYATLRLSPPTLGQIVAEGALEIDDSYIQTVKEEYDRRRRVVYDYLHRMPGVVSYLPGGAFYCFAKFPVEDAEDFCRWMLEEFDYQGKTVMLSPGGAFYATPGLGRDEVRMAYVLNANDLESAMVCLGKGLEVYSAKKDAPSQLSSVLR